MHHVFVCSLYLSIFEGNNIIYSALHLTHVSEPGFNTLIFGLTWRGAGFGYHSDQKQDLPAKDVTMIDKQPVVR